MNHPDPQLVMSGDQHFKEAERLLAVAHDEAKNAVRLVNVGGMGVAVVASRMRSPQRLECDPPTVAELRALAAIHSQLALASATWSAAVLNDAAHNVTVNVAERPRRGWRR